MSIRKFGTPEPITPVTTEGPDDQGIEVTGAIHEQPVFDPRAVVNEGREVDGECSNSKISPTSD